MVTELHIRNYALIKELTIEFGKNLNIITGETGAGKSIILGALGLLLGNRAEAKALEGNEDKCVIEGHFLVENLHLETFFEKNDLDYEAVCVLRREINTNGKSRAFVNDIPVTLNILKELGEKLVDIHSQHSNLLLKSEDFRRDFIDFVAENSKQLTDYQTNYKLWRKKVAALHQLQEQETQLTAMADFNRFQLNEIDQLKIKADEYVENEHELDRLNNAEKIAEAFSNVTQLLDGSQTSVLAQLVEMKNSLQKIVGIDAQIENLFGRIDSSFIELGDVNDELTKLSEDWVFDAQRLDYLNERQDKIQRLMRKMACETVEELLLKAGQLRSELQKAENFDQEIEALKLEINKLEETLATEAEKLHRRRQKTARQLSPTITALLKQLGIPDAQFAIECAAHAGQFQKWGIDKIEFVFSANKGLEPQDVSKVASGGEISRIMLALKTLMSNSNKFPTLVFDEIDLGISGEVAIKMGALMQELSQRHQLVCITHLPQIAAMGQHHFRVRKLQEKNRSYSTIEPLSTQERIAEIGQMIGGNNASETALNSAKELLQKFATHLN